MNKPYCPPRTVATRMAWTIATTICVCAISSILFPSQATAASPTGVWRGQWSSQSSGHRGALGARIRPDGPNQYRALFYGRFAAVIPFFYRTTLTRVPGTADVYHSAKRMPLLGTYETTATISGSSFHADFVGEKDRGVFEMNRRHP